MGRLSSWLFPYCSKPVLARGRYHAVRMDVSLRIQHLVKGIAPKTVGAVSSDASSSVPSRIPSGRGVSSDAGSKAGVGPVRTLAEARELMRLAADSSDVRADGVRTSMDGIWNSALRADSMRTSVD